MSKAACCVCKSYAQTISGVQCHHPNNLKRKFNAVDGVHDTLRQSCWEKNEDGRCRDFKKRFWVRVFGRYVR